MTKNKLKLFKKDRLFNHDFEKMNQLSDLLKKARLPESSICDPALQECPSPIKFNNASPRLQSPTSKLGGMQFGANEPKM